MKQHELTKKAGTILAITAVGGTCLVGGARAQVSRPAVSVGASLAQTRGRTMPIQVGQPGIGPFLPGRQASFGGSLAQTRGRLQPFPVGQPGIGPFLSGRQAGSVGASIAQTPGQTLPIQVGQPGIGPFVPINTLPVNPVPPPVPGNAQPVAIPATGNGLDTVIRIEEQRPTAPAIGGGIPNPATGAVNVIPNTGTVPVNPFAPTAIAPGNLGTVNGTTGFTTGFPGFATPVVPVVGGGPVIGGIPNAGMSLGGAPNMAATRYNGAGGQRTVSQPAAQPMGGVYTSNSRRTLARGAMDVATVRRFNAAANGGALRPAEVARATSGYVWIRVNNNGVASVRQVPTTNVFFYRGGELMDASTFPALVQPGERVMVADPSRMPL